MMMMMMLINSRFFSLGLGECLPATMGFFFFFFFSLSFPPLSINLRK